MFRRTAVLKRLRSLLLTVLLVLAVATTAFYFYIQFWAEQPLSIQQATRFDIATGDNFKQLLKRAARSQDKAFAKAFQARQRWKLYVRLSGADRSIQAGEFALLPEDSARDVLTRLRQGDVVRYQVALLEGWTLKQVLRALQQSAELRQTPRLGRVEYLRQKYSPNGLAAEGMFFPDTYSYIKNTPDEEILDRAHAQLEEVLQREWRTRDAGLPYASSYQALILASIIEKETGRAVDRPKIARVFVNRLQQHMPLQTDPTVIYGVGTEFDGNLTRRHLKQHTPYNTYVNRGLPPTPIALAGLASIRAALHPAPGDYLYFVARGDGSSEFSTTLSEHRAAVKRYQLNGRGP